MKYKSKIEITLTLRKFMKSIKIIAALGIIVSPLCASEPTKEIYEMMVCLPSGENTLIEIYPEDTFFEIMHLAEKLKAGKEIIKTEYLLDYRKGSENSEIIAKGNNNPRNYDVKVSQKERDDIFYIVTTLGRSSLKKLLSAKASLKKAGTRVDHIHPLKFLGCLFSDEEMKVGILQIKERGGWVGKEFFSGLYDSLNAESNLQNLKPDHISDFAAHLNVDNDLMSKFIVERDWKGMINTLIEILPRSGNPNRYDM
jgi:hypothetical protein